MWPVAVGGQQAHVGFGPVLAVVVDMDLAQRRLAVGPIEQQLRAPPQVTGELFHESRIIAGIPLQRDVQVKQRQGLRPGRRQGLHARLADRLHRQPFHRRRGAGIVETVRQPPGRRGGDWRQGNQLIAQAQDSTAAQVTQAVGFQRPAVFVHQVAGGAALPGRLAQHLRSAGRSPAFIKNPHLGAAGAEGQGLRGIARERLGQQPGPGAQAHDSRIRSAKEAGGQGVPREEIAAGRARDGDRPAGPACRRDGRLPGPAPIQRVFGEQTANNVAVRVAQAGRDGDHRGGLDDWRAGKANAGLTGGSRQPSRLSGKDRRRLVWRGAADI